MAKRTPLGEAPPERPAAKAPPVRSIAQVPKGDPMSHAPRPQVARLPTEHGVAPLPNPRKPELVRDVDGRYLGDLFAMFPDLPRPQRPPGRVPLRLQRRRIP